MHTSGHHILAEFSGCSPSILEDMESIREIMKTAAETAGADILGIYSHKFSPQGISCVTVIAESHLSIHTWPEYGYAALDVFTCGTKVDPKAAADYAAGALGAEKIHLSFVYRGIEEKPGCFSHRIETVSLTPETGGSL